MSGTPTPRRNVRTAEFRAMFAALPERIQQLAELKFAQFEADPSHPSLRVHQLKPTKAGSHRAGSVSVSITMQYRAIYCEDGDDNVWYWVGTHADYDTFIGG